MDEAPESKSASQTWSRSFLRGTPVAVSFLGAGLVVIGQTYESAAISVIGAVLSMFGAAFAQLEQQRGEERLRVANAKLLSNAEQLIGYTTGGDSYCYLIGSPTHPAIVHRGEYPIFNCEVAALERGQKRLDCDMSPPVIVFQNRFEFINLNTLLPLDLGYVTNDRDKIEWHVTWQARNGQWFQKLTWVRVNESYALRTEIRLGGEVKVIQSPEFPQSSLASL